MTIAVNPFEFVLGNTVRTAPPEVWRAAKRSLLDLIGVATAGRTTEASRTAHELAVQHWPAGPKAATLMFDGRKASAAGVAFAGAQTIDSIDAHDGYKPAKGHAGVAILPGLLAVMEAEGAQLNDAEFLTALVIGYEIACRVAAAQHATCPDYHASGSWNALGVAAVAARVMKLSVKKTHEALGIAEYFGPRAQMMRVIDQPTMVKDASDWGAMTGVLAAYLAAQGLTGAPAVTIEAVNAEPFWKDLGRRWLITEQYFKLWPVCRWAQPAVKAALDLVTTHRIDHRRVQQITIETFREACRLAGNAPTDTDQAQYAIAFPTACAFVRGRVGLDEVAGTGLHDKNVLALASRIGFRESKEFNAAFPSRRFARLHVQLDNSDLLVSPVTEPPGDPENPLSDDQLVEKYKALAVPVLGDERATTILRAVGPLDEKRLDLRRLLPALRLPLANIPS